MTASHPTAPRTRLKRLLPATGALLAAAVFVSGCANTPRDDGEKKLNDWVGRSISGSFLETDELVQKKDFDANRTQYMVPDQSGCTLGFVVDKRTKILLSWSYLRSPEKCWVSRSPL